MVAAQLGFFNFDCKYSYCADYKKKKNFQSAAQSSGRVKIFCSEQQQVRAAVKEIRGTLIPGQFVGFCGDKTGTGRGLYPNTQVFSLISHLPRAVYSLRQWQFRWKTHTHTHTRTHTHTHTHTRTHTRTHTHAHTHTHTHTRTHTRTHTHAHTHT
jgi:hypothetical protein